MYIEREIMKRAIFLFLLITHFVYFDTLLAQWEPLNTPPGGYVRSIHYDGELIYAATGGGVLVSNDEGASWTFQNTGLVSRDCKSLAQMQEYVFVATDEAIFRTNTGGLVWESAGSDLEGMYTKHLLALDETLFAATYQNGLFRSSDNGDSWESINNGFTATNAYYMATDGAALYTGTYQAGIFRSLDMGDTWMPINNGLPDMDIMAIFCFQGKVFLSTLSSGVFVSNNNGDLWMPIGTSLPSVKGFAAHNSILYAIANGGGVYTSEDMGDSWEAFNDGLSDTSLWAVGKSDSNLFVGSKNGYVYQRNFSSGDWMNSSQLNFSACVGTLRNTGTKLLAATHGSGFYTSETAGSNWSQINSIWTVENRAIFVAEPNVLVGTDLLGVFKSVDNGTTFSMSNTGLTSTWIQSFTSCQGSVFAGTRNQGVFRSESMGDSWIPANVGMSMANVLSLASDGEYVYAGTSMGVYRTEDQGETWLQTNSGLPSDKITALSIYDGGVWAGTRSNGVFLSTDDGETWISASEGLTITAEIRVLHAYGEYLFIGTGSGLVYVWNANSMAWSSIGGAISDGPILSLWTLGMDLHATTNEGSIWKHPLESVLEVTEFSNLNALVVYPNPVQEKLYIQIKEDVNLYEINLFDITGRKVMGEIDLYDGCDISSLPQGVYVAQIITNLGKSTHKILKN